MNISPRLLELKWITSLEIKYISVNQTFENKLLKVLNGSLFRMSLSR